MPSSTFNLHNFLHHVTPSFPCHRPPHYQTDPCADSSERPRTTTKPMMMRFFCLSDLWRCFDEWSVYGAGVPLLLPCGETIVQYYVPYLSALQIYYARQASSDTKRSGSESDWSDVYDARSDFGSDEDNEKASALRTKGEQWDSLSCESSDQCSCVSSEQDDRQGELAFEYFERCSPYWRTPLAGKIRELSVDFPQLYALKTSELSAASWVSVAWYPIYRIPTGPTMSDLSTCFLTFHSLWIPPLDLLRGGSKDSCKNGLSHEDGPHPNSSAAFFRKCVADACSIESARSFRGEEMEQWLQDHDAWRFKQQGAMVELPAFGLASFKLRGGVWDSDAEAKRRIDSLLDCADSWVRQLGVQHPDYDFFLTRQGGCGRGQVVTPWMRT